ncbi:Gfo/Idh/MocA family oxidoreductase [Mucilaginibacter defluvii]|uniref:Gfo/Idh/MocA family oxidoreductase n=1 Tax=Mucilaginibacter defluvii TaxID=1196019 RepID=A0ABP9FGL4_9SPHI
MSNKNIPEDGPGYNRRRFIENAGKTIIASGIIGASLNNDAEAQTPAGTGSKKTSDAIKVELPPIHAPSEKQDKWPAISPPAKRVGYALVGLGNLTLAELLPAFAECKYSKVVALVSGSPDKAKKVAEQYGIAEKNIYNYQNYDSISKNPEIDAVYIVLPNSMHKEYTIRAAKAGKHVLCEKPMANSSAEAQEMIDACKKAGKKLMIAYRIQYEPHNRLAMQWTREKKFGQVKVINSINVQNSGAPPQWRLDKELAGGGSLPDIGLYCSNTNRFLLGEEPHTVLASMYSTPNDPRFKEVEETVMFQMFFPSGAVANNLCSYGVHDSKHYRCYADNGGWFGLDPAFAYHGLKMEVSQTQGDIEMKQNPSKGEKNQFALEIDHFSECVMDNKTPYTPGEEGLQDHKVLEAIYESAKTGKPVKLERIEKLDAFRGSPPTES